MTWLRRPSDDDNATTAQIAALRDDVRELARLTITLSGKITAMSDTLTTELAAIKAALANLQSAVTTDTTRISDLAAQLAAALATASTGAPTPEQLAELAADAQTIQAAADALNAAAAPAQTA